MVDREEVFRRLTLGDEAFLDTLIARRRAGPNPTGLDHARAALVRLGALAATDGSDLSWEQTVGGALNAGVTTDEIVDILVVLAPILGVTRVVSIAPKVAIATGYDVVTDLETLERDPLVCRPREDAPSETGV